MAELTEGVRLGRKPICVRVSATAVEAFDSVSDNNIVGPDGISHGIGIELGVKEYPCHASSKFNFLCEKLVDSREKCQSCWERKREKKVCTKTGCEVKQQESTLFRRFTGADGRIHPRWEWVGGGGVEWGGVGWRWVGRRKRGGEEGGTSAFLLASVEAGERKARPPHHDWMQTLLAKDELYGWSGLRP